ncbi:hypothetical protein DFO48_10724 [Comamonas sp. AG1104]|nr:hypothetical protein DFO48_10724 [Comamonas sp. AG1104]
MPALPSKPRRHGLRGFFISVANTQRTELHGLRRRPPVHSMPFFAALHAGLRASPTHAKERAMSQTTNPFAVVRA